MQKADLFYIRNDSWPRTVLMWTERIVKCRQLFRFKLQIYACKLVHIYGMPNRWQHWLCCDWLCSMEHSIHMFSCECACIKYYVFFFSLWNLHLLSHAHTHRLEPLFLSLCVSLSQSPFPSLSVYSLWHFTVTYIHIHCECFLGFLCTKF